MLQHEWNFQISCFLHYTKQKKPDTREHMWYFIESIWNVQNRQVHGDRKQVSHCLGLDGEKPGLRWGLSPNEHTVSFRDDENILKVMLTQLYEYTKTIELFKKESQVKV